MAHLNSIRQKDRCVFVVLFFCFLFLLPFPLFIPGNLCSIYQLTYHFQSLLVAILPNQSTESFHLVDPLRINDHDGFYFKVWFICLYCFSYAVSLLGTACSWWLLMRWHLVTGHFLLDTYTNGKVSWFNKPICQSLWESNRKLVTFVNILELLLLFLIIY